MSERFFYGCDLLPHNPLYEVDFHVSTLPFTRLPQKREKKGREKTGSFSEVSFIEVTSPHLVQ